jgi:hypothetical protein
MKHLQTIRLGIILCSAMPMIGQTAPSTNVTEAVSKQSLTTIERLWQKLKCIYFLESFCAPERRLFYINPVCSSCYHCLNDERACVDALID